MLHIIANQDGTITLAKEYFNLVIPIIRSMHNIIKNCNVFKRAQNFTEIT